MFTKTICASLFFATIQIFAAPLPPITVFTEKAKTQEIFTTLTFPARVESLVNATVRAESDGAVSKINRPLGSRVYAGQVVATIKHTDPVYEFAPMGIISPVSGVVSSVSITLGSLVNKSDAIVTVTDPSHLRVMIEVSASDIEYLRTGLKGELSVTGFEHPLSAFIKGFSPSIDPVVGTASAELNVAEKDRHKVISGMVGRVQFQVNRHNGFLLPDYAIVYRGEDAFVRVVKDGKATRIPIKLGAHADGQVEIRSGLNIGDVVVERASRFVPDGASVQVETAHE